MELKAGLRTIGLGIVGHSRMLIEGSDLVVPGIHEYSQEHELVLHEHFITILLIKNGSNDND